MPVKKKTAKKPRMPSLASAKAAVKQVVNVRVGDVSAKRKRATRAPNPLMKQAPPINLSLSTQSYNNPQPQPYLNEYNTLLRQLADERMTRAASAPPLAANTSPLTINQQRNTLLSKVEAQPKLPGTNIFENVVDIALADDPFSNENMFINSSRLGEKIAPKLPASNFDYSDIDNYDSENIDELKNLESQVIKTKDISNSKKRLVDEEGNLILPRSQVKEVAEEAIENIITKVTKKPTNKEKLLSETNDLIKFWNSEVKDNINLVKMTESKKKIETENKRIKGLIDSKALKVSKRAIFI